jgi:hypothetical protein
LENRRYSSSADILVGIREIGNLPVGNPALQQNELQIAGEFVLTISEALRLNPMFPNKIVSFRCSTVGY